MTISPTFTSKTTKRPSNDTTIIEIQDEDLNFAGTLEDNDDESRTTTTNTTTNTKCGRYIDETTPLITEASIHATPPWLKRLVSAYEESAKENPNTTMACQAFILSSMGDVCAQLITKKPFEVRRLCSVGIWAFFVTGPVGLWWYEYLMSKVSGRYAVIQWVAIDQLFFAPIFIAFFIVGTTALEGEVFEIWDRLRINLIPTIFANYLIWPAAQAINYLIIPHTWRMLYVNIVGFFWSIILTFFSHNTAENGPGSAKIHLLNSIARECYNR